MFTSKGKVMGMLFILLLTWSFPSVVIKYLSYFFSPLTQNFYRYLAASVFLIIFNYFSSPQELKLCIRKIRYFIIPAFLLFLYQTLFVYGIGFSQANTAGFLSKLAVIFVILVAWIELPDERSTIRNKSFITGFFLAFTGAVMITLSKGTPSFSLGSSLIILSNLLWAIYTIHMKKLLRELRISPVMAMSFITIIASIFMFFPAINKLSRLCITPVSVNFLLFISGFFLVGAAGSLYYFLLNKIGATITNNALLLTSFITLGLSFIFLKESISIWQVLGGILLIPGCYFILRKTQIPGGEIQA
ncbi:DMT family transporter [Candidatus Aerophobetes bacterium]|nr:DMT family transporter [Candidatus Aerophobetes bacterium]